MFRNSHLCIVRESWIRRMPWFPWASGRGKRFCRVLSHLKDMAAEILVLAVGGTARFSLSAPDEGRWM